MSTREFITEVLAHRRFTALIGRDEDLWFEAKENHEFDLDGNPRDRVELSKDVSALANGEGGFLLIGLKTTQVIEEQTDRVTELDLLKQAKFNVDQFHGVITDSIHPRIRGLDVRWIESAETPSRGLACITVPVQDPDDQPFLMKRVIEGGAELQHIVFGIARRVGSRNQPRTFEELHLAVRQGKASLADRLTRIESQLTNIVTEIARGASAAPTPDARLRDRTDRVFKHE